MQGSTSVGKVMSLIESAKPNSAEHVQANISFGLWYYGNKSSCITTLSSVTLLVTNIE